VTMGIGGSDGGASPIAASRGGPGVPASLAHGVPDSPRAAGPTSGVRLGDSESRQAGDGDPIPRPGGSGPSGCEREDRGVRALAPDSEPPRRGIAGSLLRRDLASFRSGPCQPLFTGTQPGTGTGPHGTSTHH
jgi:hypothetical protein